VNRRTTGIAAAAVVVLALVVAGALALGGGDDEPRGGMSETGTEAAGGTAAAGEPSPGESEPERQAESDPGDETAPEPEPEPEPAPEPDPAPAPAPEPARYAPYSGSGGEWQTLVPSGAEWRKPVEAERVPGRRYRTTIRGPRGAVLLIDHSPLAAVGFGSEYGSKRELTHPWFGSMTEYRLADGSVGYILNASEGGPGFRVFASGADPAVARRVADELAYADL
jgi:hypothetical protein